MTHWSIVAMIINWMIKLGFKIVKFCMVIFCTKTFSNFFLKFKKKNLNSKDEIRTRPLVRKAGNQDLNFKSKHCVEFQLEISNFQLEK